MRNLHTSTDTKAKWQASKFRFLNLSISKRSHAYVCMYMCIKRGY